MNNQMFSGDIRPSGYKIRQLQQFTPDQMQLLESLYPQVGKNSFLQQISSGQPGAFNEIEAPALQQFSEMLGGLGSRFSSGGGQGSLGLRKSSGFQNTATSALGNFAQQLQSQRQQLRQQALQDLMGYSNMLLNQRPYERFLAPKQEKSSGWGGLIGSGLGAVGGFFAGGPAGALTGAQLGQQLGSAF